MPVYLNEMYLTITGVQIQLKALFGYEKQEYISKSKQVQRICLHDTVGTLELNQLQAQLQI